MNKDIEMILDSYQNEMIEKLQQLIKIKSVNSETKQGAPFGHGIQESLEFVMKLGCEKGFECINFDDYACEINLGNATESVGVVCHLDVVPEGPGWNFDPYGGEIENGKIYGRGAVDDKGPLIAVFYAIYAIRESGVFLSKKIKHIIGTNEEGGEFPCIRYYKEHGDVPACGIVPDSWFPVAYAEKGFYNYQFSRKIGKANDSDIRLIRIKGGESFNIVAPYAMAEVIVNDRGYQTVLKTLENFEKKEKVEIQREGKQLYIKTYGKAAHASTPELGINAISILLAFLSKFKYSPFEFAETINMLERQVGRDSDGTGLGVNCSDNTGQLTNNIGEILYSEENLILKMNLRCPVTFKPEEITEKLRLASEQAKMVFELINYNPPFYMSEEDPLLKLLVGVYQDVTGDARSKPKAHGGGSYARILKNFIPFGPSIQGEELCFHKQDEYISCDRLLLLSKIYAEALYQMAK